MIAIILSLVIFLFTLLLVRNWQKHSYWSSKGVPAVSYLPFLGHLHKFLFGFRWESIDKIYYQIKSHGYCGLYSMFTPELMVTDPDIVRDVLVKEADSFIDRRDFKMSDDKSNFKEMLSVLSGQQWKSLRSLMTPTFTSGKIKAMFPLIESHGDQLIIECDKEMENNRYVEMFDLMSHYTLDTIATCAFGIDAKCLQNRDKSLFVQNCKSIVRMDFFNVVKLLMTMYVPKLTSTLKLSITGDVKFLENVVMTTMDSRKDGENRRGDFLDLLLDALREREMNNDDSKYPITTKTIISESFLFIFAGFDTTGNAATMVTYMLAKDKEAQSRLRSELESLIEKDKEFNYHNIMEAQYLDACIMESLRIYPPGHTLERKCTKAYTIPGSDVEIPENMIVSVPVWSIHRDKDYWEDPLKFKPERFLPENKDKIVPYTYMPFGLGPRNCIAMRFAQLELKLVTAKLFYNYEITLRPGYKGLTLAKNPATLRPDKNGVQLALKKIQRT